MKFDSHNVSFLKILNHTFNYFRALAHPTQMWSDYVITKNLSKTP